MASDELQAEVENLLERQFGSFLPHDPYSPSTFWRGMAHDVLSIIDREVHKARVREALLGASARVRHIGDES